MHDHRRHWGKPILGLMAVWGAFFCTLPDQVPGAPSGSSVPTGSNAALAGPTAQVANLPSVSDGWTTSTTLRTADGWYATPVHATLLPDGRVLFTGIARNADPPTATTTQRRVSWVMPIQALGSPMTASTVITEVREPVTYDVPLTSTAFTYDDLICSGQTLTADGKVVTAGGTRASKTNASSTLYVAGLPTETKFDGTTWNQYPGSMLATGANGSPDRWYPTVTRLPDTKLLVTGGYEDVAPTPSPIPAVETLDPNTGARTLFSDRSTTPASITNRDYTHVFVLPTATSANDLLMIGEQSVAVEASTVAPGRYSVMTGRPGYTGAAGLNWGTSSLMLPIRTTDSQWGYHNGAVMIASGNMGSAYQHRADIFDPITGAWKTSLDLQVNRHHPSSVNLPDGRVLLVNGHDMAGDPQVKQAEYIDPAQNFKVSLGTANEGVVRGYHSIALLMPDGRVLVGGGRDQDTNASLEKPSFQFYLPDYLTKPRPVISSAPSQLNFASLVGITTTGPPPSEVVLVGLGSMTHSFDSNQRYVQLPIGLNSTNASGASLVIAGAPANSHVAPPGYYMLFVLDANRVPSVAKIVHVG
ncbi:MAG: galactose oxidase-like domain-containing protein [Acidimicrobiales bacterium]